MRPDQIVLAALVAAGLAIPCSVLAEEPDWIQSARTAFGAYDIEATRTTDALAALRAHLLSAPTASVTEMVQADPATEEARFLSAAVAADLVDVALCTGDDALLRRVAAAFRVPPSRVAATVQAELTATSTGPFAAAARDSLAGLELATARGARRTTLLASMRGPRRDLAWLGDVRGVLEDAHDPLAALAAVSADPCVDVDAQCDAIYTAFLPNGRRAIATVVQARSTLTRIEQSAAVGDPFAVAVVDRARAHWSAFVGLELRPAVRVGAFLHVTSNGDMSATRGPELLVAVSARDVKWAFLPRIDVTDAGPEIFSLGSPALPEVGAVALPATGAPNRPIDALVAALDDVAGPTLTEVAMGAAADAPSDALARVYASLQQAGWSSPRLWYLAADGTARTMRVRAFQADEEARGRLHIAVRPGGYWVFAHQGEQFIPRVRMADGWQFDTAALVAEVDRTRQRSAIVSFHGPVASGAVLAALADVHTRTVIGLQLP